MNRHWACFCCITVVKSWGGNRRLAWLLHLEAESTQEDDEEMRAMVPRQQASGQRGKV